MSRVKRYFRGPNGSMIPHARGEFVLSMDYDALAQQLAASQEEVESLQRWRELALQFDNHRMQALGHLKALAQSPEHASQALEFLSSPPLAAHEVVAQLAARDKRIAEAEVLLRYLRDETAYEARDRIEAFLSPAEDKAND